MRYATLQLFSDSPGDIIEISVRPEHVSFVEDHIQGGSTIVFGNGEKRHVGGSRKQVDEVLEAIGDDLANNLMAALRQVDETLKSYNDRIAALEDRGSDE